VAYTDGEGVVLRSEPRLEARLPHGYTEGTVVTVLEPSGDWLRVRGEDGQEGWIPTRYLVPTDLPPAPDVVAPEAAAQDGDGSEAAAPSPEGGADAGEPQPAPAGLAEGTRVHVAGTDGTGVVLRTAPQASARVPRGLLEGASATVLERTDDGWVRVRGNNGLEGWVPGAYLQPDQ
jgi:SH3-like domain-containing protein